jgi:low affinity Fe/Cu permease
MNEFFHKIAHKSSEWMGSPWAFIVSTFLVVVWGVTGPWFDYSDTWQLVINTATTVLTFLAVFLIQNTQNRDAKAIHLKLDELIRSVSKARNQLVDLENLSDAELDGLQKEFEDLRARSGVIKEPRR